MKGFTFFENFFESISDPSNGLTPEEEGAVYRAILYYVFHGEILPLNGAGRMAFNLIKPSLDISRTRAKARKKESETPNENQNRIKIESNENQSEIKSENLTFLEETETEIRDDTRQNACAQARACVKETPDPSYEADVTDISEAKKTVKAYKDFLSGHPDIVVDITNPNVIATVDWELLGKKIGESRILKPKRSLRWLISHYREIVGDSYKDYERSAESTKEEEAALRRKKFIRDHPWTGEGG